MQSIKIYGNIEKFNGNGRKFGYPTANIRTQTELSDGVYFGFAELEDYHHHPSLIFIGTPTTIGDTERRIEAHLLDIPDVDYYGKKLKLSVEHFHRDNQTLGSVEKLLEIMADDDRAARLWFKSSTGSDRL